MVKKIEDIFIRFGATHECDRQTDIALHGKNSLYIHCEHTGGPSAASLAKSLATSKAHV